MPSIRINEDIGVVNLKITDDREGCTTTEEPMTYDEFIDWAYAMIQEVKNAKMRR